MENYEQKKLGAGIITMSVIHLVIYAFAILGLVFSLFMGDAISQQLELAGQDPNAINPTQITISLILSIIMLISVILILFKKAIGVYGYFIITIIDMVNSLITTKFVLWSFLVGLILPALMAFFIYKRKYVFGFKSKDDDLTA